MTRLCSVYRGADLIAKNVRCADTFWTRLAGLQGKRPLGEDEGLLLSPCNQIHTFNMRFAIDALFLSRDGTVLHIEESMKPGKISPRIARCAQVLELAGGSIHQYGILQSATLSIIRP